jgi:lauroyl/myristoyl acyltransferase
VKDLPWAAWRVLRKAIFMVFGLRTHQEIAVLRGWVHGRIMKVPDPVRNNIESTLGSVPGLDVERVVRRTQEFHKTSLLMYVMPRLRGFDERRRWHVDGLENLDTALESKRGVLLLTAHLGYGRLIGPVLRIYGYDVLLVAAKLLHAMERERTTRWLKSGSRFRRYVHERTRVVAEILEPDDLEANLDVRPIFDALAHNRPVLIAGDGQRSIQFESISILGRAYRFSTGFMRIAMRAGCPVLPVFGLEGRRGQRVRIEIQPPLPIDPTASVATNLSLFAGVLEEQLYRTPHLWGKWQNEDLFATPDEWRGSLSGDPYQSRFLEQA